jgi:hypothetical protein
MPSRIGRTFPVASSECHGIDFLQGRLTASRALEIIMEDLCQEDEGK